MGDLKTYRRRRDFDKTAEPAGSAAGRRSGKPSAGGMFVIQKHAARRLHYDLRLELDGVLKSWAVPKGPSFDPAVRRLAMHVEDHPLEYGDFEGVIPKGEYGAGPVMVWDTGRWEPVGDPHEGYGRGDLKFRLRGERLNGSWVLVHMKPKRNAEGETRDENAWLLIKERDEAARPGATDPWGDDDRSVSSRRTMQEILEGKPAGGKPLAKGKRPAGRRSAAGHGRRTDGDEGAGRGAATDADRSAGRGAAAQAGDAATDDAGSIAPLPDTVPFTLATLVDQPPEGDGWVHEIKYDGYRLLARFDDGDVRLITRNGLDWTSKFGAVAEGLEELEAQTALLDGEVVVYRPDGVSDFGALQQALKEGRDGDLTYMAFDLLHLDGHDLRGLPLIERKRRLARLLDGLGGPAALRIRLSDDFIGAGSDFRAEACRRGLEGVVSKRADGPYPGRRTRAWRKSKCGRRQEFVVGGYTDPAGSRSGFGALLLGTYDQGGALRYAGKVGAGFGDDDLRHLSARLKAAGRVSSSFEDVPRAVRDAHWVTPKLVVEVAFAEWTSDGRLRQPVFNGVREDKPAKLVRREGMPAGDGPATGAASSAVAAAADGGSAGKRRLAGETRGSAGRQKPAGTPGGSAGPGRPARERAGSPSAEVAGVRISHPDRVVYPELEMTKLDVARYYEAVAERMLPHLEGRPLTVIRCPGGADDECFFQKHPGASLPRTVARIRVPEAKGSDVYPVVNDVAGLVSMVQIGVLELHVRGSRQEALEAPDRMVFDLDPAPDVQWREVRAGARRLRDGLERHGLVSFLMTSGGKGLHVIVPLRPEAGWDAVGAFAREMAEQLVDSYPGKYTATMSKAKRTGKVFIDHFRNGRGATAVAPYSLRARAGAPVATPLTWADLGRTTGGAQWDAPRVLRRLRAKDPWPGASFPGLRPLPG